MDSPATPALPAPIPSPSPLAIGPVRLLEAFFAGRNPRTLLAYRADLEDFRTFLGAEDLPEAASRLLGHGQGEANAVALAYRAKLLERGLAPATINRRVTALRSLVRLGRLLGHVPWTLEIPSVRSEAYRDTRGPTLDEVRRVFGSAAERRDPKGIRDYALLRLHYDVALRRGEVVALDLADLDLAAGTAAILGKGRTQKELRTLPEPTKAALAAWLAVRGATPGPLFTNFDRARKGQRLTGTSAY
ncbi:MAG: site-specific integrase, partial [Planctomycetales bacterium]|nr:site-specific integrase [Planctomycetales bacterium]